MRELNQVFLAPFLVASLAGLLLYWVQLKRQKATTRQALASEINLILLQARDFRDYLIQDSHAWLQEGITLKESPVLAGSTYRVFSALLPNLHLLSSKEISCVLEFYSHYENCEKLIEILFGRLQGQEKAGHPLTGAQIALTKKRAGRIVSGLDSILNATSGRINSLNELPIKCRLEAANPITLKEIS